MDKRQSRNSIISLQSSSLFSHENQEMAEKLQAGGFKVLASTFFTYIESCQLISYCYNYCWLMIFVYKI